MDRFDIILRIEDKHYLFSTIRLLPEKVELFYHYSWGGRRVGTNQSEDGKHSMEGYLSDHFSFHADGQIHSKAKDDKKKKIYLNPLNAGSNIFNIDRGKFIPFIVDSALLNDSAECNPRLKLIDIADYPNCHVWDVAGLKAFSIILVSKCSRINPELLIKNHGFENLTFIGRSVSLRFAFSKKNKQSISNKEVETATDILVMMVRQIWTKLPETPPVNCSYKGCTITMPPMDLIGKMK
ncbi:MAG: hypothetical protein JRD93_06450 [Deltaproteobacteria bacterium]|nr:hypothetical protein [Deltaproteobacteria bacterium]